MRRNELILTLASALLLAVSRLPLHLGWLVFFGWVPLLHVFERGVARRSRLLKMGFVMAAAYILIVFYWFGLVTVPGLIGMVLLFTGVYYLCFYAIERIFRTLPAVRYLGFVAVMLTFEYGQNYGETRFPWWNNAYSLADYNILVQMADLFGVIGLSALILTVNVLIYRILFISRKWLRDHSNAASNVAHPYGRRRVWCVAGLLLIFAGWLGYGYFCLNHKPLQRHDAGIFVMQPSIPQDLKWDEAQYSKSLALFGDLTLRAAADSARLVIYPEGSITNYLLRVTKVQNDLRAILDTAKVDIFTGFPDVVAAPPEHINNELYYNAASLFQPDSFYHDVYYKNILVPVGERMLWLDRFPFMWKLQFGQANWEFGKDLAYFSSGGFTFSPSICYELAFPDIFHQMASPWDYQTGGYKKSDYLVNITNDAWFGTSYGPWLHAAMVRFRAVENRIQVYRSANTGISLIVDPQGRILARTKLFEVKNITAPLYTSPEITLARKIYRWPLGVVALAALLVLISSFIPIRRQA